jgi:microcystin-dependent protein
MANLKIEPGAALDKNGFIQNYPVGTIIIRANSTIDNGWLLCDGRYVNTADYPELDAHVGITYGARVGATFRLPPLVYNVTNNPTERMPFSTISSEAAYPNVFTHNHTVGFMGTTFSEASHSHNHNTNTATSRSDSISHNHGNISGNTTTSNNPENPSANANNLFSAGRLTGNAGPYASANTAATLNHTHTGGAWSDTTQNYSVAHTHTVTIHTATNHNHGHNTNLANLSHSVNSSSSHPLSKQVYFLIKT